MQFELNRHFTALDCMIDVTRGDQAVVSGQALFCAFEVKLLEYYDEDEPCRHWEVGHELIFSKLLRMARTIFIWSSSFARAWTC